jgi:hypothetical protein
METENLSDADRIAANADALSRVESEIVSLERHFAEIESLKTEQHRLSTAVQTLTEEETRILGDDGSGNETALVKRLGELRTRRDVQQSRLNAVQDRIRNAEADLTTQGAAVRKVFAGVMAQLWTARQQRVTATLTEMFGSPFIRLRIGRAELRELVDQTVLMRELRDSRNRFTAPIGDKEQETLALQRSRTWFAEISKLVNDERLVLRTVPAKQQPIVVQPAREMATV